MSWTQEAGIVSVSAIAHPMLSVVPDGASTGEVGNSDDSGAKLSLARRGVVFSRLARTCIVMPWRADEPMSRAR